MGAALGSIMPIIIIHHIASNRSRSTTPLGGMIMLRLMPDIERRMSAAARER